MHIVLNDYAGHAFPLQLAAHLSGRGHRVVHNCCTSNVTPRGDTEEAAAAGVSIDPIDLGRTFEKYRPLRRAFDELDYGLRSAFRLWLTRPDVALFAQLPILSLLVCMSICRIRRIRNVLWLQDLQSQLACSQSRTSGAILSVLERSAIRWADQVVAISPEIAHVALQARNDCEVEIIENWARLIPQVSKDNDWSRQIDAKTTFNFVYTGTLGVKHRPKALAALAEEFSGDPTVKVIAVCAGQGRESIKSCTNLDLFDLVSPTVLPQVLGAADVLLVLLDDSAAESVVPSKLHAYLVAGRPVLALMPQTNLAARTIADRAHAGLVATSEEELIKLARVLLNSPGLRQDLAENARYWATQNFDIDSITTRFEQLITE